MQNTHEPVHNGFGQVTHPENTGKNKVKVMVQPAFSVNAQQQRHSLPCSFETGFLRLGPCWCPEEAGWRCIAGFKGRLMLMATLTWHLVGARPASAPKLTAHGFASLKYKMESCPSGDMKAPLRMHQKQLSRHRIPHNALSAGFPPLWLLSAKH